MDCIFIYFILFLKFVSFVIKRHSLLLGMYQLSRYCREILKMCLAQQYYDKQRRVTVIKKSCVLQSAKLHVIGDFEEMLSSAIL